MGNTPIVSWVTPLLPKLLENERRGSRSFTVQAKKRGGEVEVIVLKENGSAAAATAKTRQRLDARNTGSFKNSSI